MTNKMRRIATEEAFSIPEIAAELKKVVRGPSSSLDKLLVKGIYDHQGGDPGYDRINFLAGGATVSARRYTALPGVDAGICLPVKPSDNGFARH
jgi:5-carboxyvanillate decarboxylase